MNRARLRELGFELGARAEAGVSDEGAWFATAQDGAPVVLKWFPDETVHTPFARIASGPSQTGRPLQKSSIALIGDPPVRARTSSMVEYSPTQHSLTTARPTNSPPWSWTHTSSSWKATRSTRPCLTAAGWRGWSIGCR